MQPDPGLEIRAPAPRAGTLLPDDMVLVRRTDVLDAAIPSGTVLLDRRRSLSHFLNSSSSAIWHSIDGTFTVAELSEKFSHDVDQTTSPVIGIADQVRQAIESFARLELVHERGELQARLSTPSGWIVPASASPDLRSALDGQLAGGKAVGPVRVAGAAVLLAADDPDVREHLDAVTASLPTVPAADHLVEVRCRADQPGWYQIRVDGREEGRAEGTVAAIRIATTALNRLAAACTPGHLLLHAGAVERDGRALVLPGLSGRGKSTLTAALVSAGSSYLTDELVAVAPGGEVLPYPKAIDLSASSCELLGIEAPATSGKAGVPPLELGSIAGPVPIGAIVILSGEPPVGQGGISGPLEPIQALVELLPNAFSGSFETIDGLVPMVSLVENVSVYRLDRLPLDHSVELLAGLRLR